MGTSFTSTLYNKSSVKVSLRLIEGGKARILSDSYDGLDQDDVVTVLWITMLPTEGDDVEVEDSAKEYHIVKKFDLAQNNSYTARSYTSYY